MRGLWPLCFALGAVAAAAASGRLSAERSAVWGPGLRAEAALPARYFYVQAVDAEGQR